MYMHGADRRVVMELAGSIYRHTDRAEWLPWMDGVGRRRRTLVYAEHSVLLAAIPTSRTNKAWSISAWRNDLNAFLFLFSAVLPAGPNKGRILSLSELNPPLGSFSLTNMNEYLDYSGLTK